MIEFWMLLHFFFNDQIQTPLLGIFSSPIKNHLTSARRFGIYYLPLVKEAWRLLLLSMTLSLFSDSSNSSSALCIALRTDRFSVNLSFRILLLRDEIFAKGQKMDWRGREDYLPVQQYSVRLIFFKLSHLNMQGKASTAGMSMAMKVQSSISNEYWCQKQNVLFNARIVFIVCILAHDPDQDFHIFCAPIILFPPQTPFPTIFYFYFISQHFSKLQVANYKYYFCLIGNIPFFHLKTFGSFRCTFRYPKQSKKQNQQNLLIKFFISFISSKLRLTL